MNFQSLETKHYAMIIIGFIVLVLLIQWDTDETFNVVPLYPHIPPKYWNQRRRTHWSPHWYYENEYHPAVPKVVQYDSSNYILPYGKEDLVNGPHNQVQDITVEEVE